MRGTGPKYGRLADGTIPRVGTKVLVHSIKTGEDVPGVIDYLDPKDPEIRVKLFRHVWGDIGRHCFHASRCQGCIYSRGCRIRSAPTEVIATAEENGRKKKVEDAKAQKLAWKRKNETLRQKQKDIVEGRLFKPAWPGGDWGESNRNLTFGLSRGMKFRKRTTGEVVEIESVRYDEECDWGMYVLKWSGGKGRCTFATQSDFPDFIHRIEAFTKNYTFVGGLSSASTIPRRGLPSATVPSGGVLRATATRSATASPRSAQASTYAAAGKNLFNISFE